MTVCTFTIRTIETGQLVGQAVLCAEARYCSVLWQGATRPDRRFATPETWKAVLSELGAQLQPGPLERDSAIALLLAGAGRVSAFSIQYLWQEPIEKEPADVVLELDQRLQMVQQG
jgi:hypothetical protein